MKNNTLLLLSLLCFQCVTAMEIPSNSGSDSSEDCGVPKDPNYIRYIERMRSMDLVSDRRRLAASILDAHENADVPGKGIERGKKFPLGRTRHH